MWPHMGGCRAYVVLAVFVLHNAWNCWCFLNFTNAAPAVALLGVSTRQVGMITAAGWCGILTSLPMVTLITKRHRSLLIVAGLVNACVPVARYYCANPTWAKGSGFTLIVGSNWLMGAAFGVIGVWPPMLAAIMWPKRRHTLVTAVGALSNNVGGAFGVALMPVIASTPQALLNTLQIQAYAAIPLTVMLAAWILWIPPFGGMHRSHAACAQLAKLCFKRRSATLVATGGLLIGLSLLLQGVDQSILMAIGFSERQCGVANASYLLAAAVVGVVAAFRLQSAVGLRSVLRVLHVVAASGLLGLLCLSAAVRMHGRFAAATPLMVLAMSVMGASLMAMFPLMLQLAVNELDGPENMVSGLVLMVAVAVAAGLTEIVSVALSGLSALALVGALLALELMAFFVLDGCQDEAGQAFSTSALTRTDDRQLLEAEPQAHTTEAEPTMLSPTILSPTGAHHPQVMMRSTL